MDKFQKFLESIESSNPRLVKGIGDAYNLIIQESRDSMEEGMLSNLGNKVKYAIRPGKERDGGSDPSKVPEYVESIKEDPRHLFRLNPGMIAAYPKLMYAFLTSNKKGMVPHYVKQFLSGAFDNKSGASSLSYGDAIRKVLDNNPKLAQLFDSFKGLEPSFESLGDESELTAEEVGGGEPASSLDTVGEPSTDISSIAESQDISTTENDPMVEEDADEDYAEQGVARIEGLESCMKKMKSLVDEHGYWSEPVKQYSAEMESDSSLSAEDRAQVHSTHMNMY